MHLPRHFVEDRPQVVSGLLRASGFGHLVCVDAGAPVSTPVPFVVDDAISSVRAHVARPNPVWRLAPCPALLIVAVDDAYISPSWYPSKAEHGKVVPTWNYEVVHLHGRLELHDDPEWVRDQIGALVALNEAPMPEPWQVTDAPADFVAAQVAGIVGMEVLVDRVEAKRKLSQNRSDPDIAGVVQGLRAQDQRRRTVLDAMDDNA